MARFLPFLLLFLVGCGGGGGDSGGGGNIFGFVFGTNELPAAEVAVGGTETNFGGRFGTAGGGTVLIVGGSVGDASIRVPLDTTGGTVGLSRPVFLPPIASGLQSGLIVNDPLPQVLDSVRLPGVTVTVQAMTSFNHNLLRLLPLAPDMLPSALPAGSATRCGFLLDPHDLELSPAADLTLPNLDALGFGMSAELLRFDPETNSYTNVGTLQVDQGTATLTATGVLDRGGLYVVIPPGSPDVTRVVGRLLSPSGTPVAGYTVLLPGSLVTTTDVDGRFDVSNVPVHDGPIMVRVQNAPSFGDEFFSEGPFTATVGGLTDIGNISVDASPRDLISPIVTYNPSDGATNVNEASSIRLTFNEPIDLGSFSVELIGLTGSIPGAISFSGDGQVVTFQPIDALDNAETYTILLGLGTTDLASNPVDSEDNVSRFTTRSNPGTPPTDVRLFGLDRLDAEVGTDITLFGQNFTGASTVTIGGVTATTTIQTETSIRAVVPLTLVGGNHPVRVDGVGNLDLEIFPTIDDLSPAMGLQAGGDTVTVSGGGFGTSPTVTFNGNTAAVVTAANDEVTVVVPANTRSGPVVVTANGRRSSDRFFFTSDDP